MARIAKKVAFCASDKNSMREREREEDETIRVIDLTILVEHNLFEYNIWIHMNN